MTLNVLHMHLTLLNGWLSMCALVCAGVRSAQIQSETAKTQI